MEETATLLVCCPDRKGLVAALAQVLYGHGANILDADQHTDPVAGQFFQRIKFDMSELHTDRRSLETAVSEVAERFSMSWRLCPHPSLGPTTPSFPCQHTLSSDLR